jgi:hypothetical protein
MKKSLCAIFFTIFFLICTSCSDNHSHTEEPVSQTASIAGILTDPPIEGARVFPISRKTLKPFPFNDSTAKTDSNGKFFLLVPSQSLNEISYLESFGGTDSQTGLSFDNISFKTIFNPDSKSSITITPLTSLIYHLVSDFGFSYEKAKSKTKALFNIPPEISPEQNPLSDTSLLKAAAFISYAAVLKKTEQPFKEIADILKNKQSFITGNSVDEGILDEIFTDAEKTRLSKNFFNFISQKKSADQIIGSSKIFFLRNYFLEGITALIKNDDTEYDNHIANIENNINILSDILAGNRIKLNKNTVIQTLRYILNEYGLAEIKFENGQYKFEGVFFTGTINSEQLYNSDGIHITEDKNIERSSSPLFSIIHNEPVLTNEIPGNDNSKRIEYYFNSDISHLYLASKTLDYVYDDAKRDEILRQIIRGYSKSGLFNQAELIADTYIFTPAQKCLSYFFIGQDMVSYKRVKEALDIIKKGEKIFWNIAENKGYHLFEKDDAERFIFLITSLAKAGSYDLLNSNLSRLKSDVIPEIENNFSTYSRILSGIYLAVNNMLENEDSENWETELLTDLLFELSKNCPPNESDGKKYYKMKIFAMAKAALFYGQINQYQKLNDVYEEIESIRQNDQLRSDVSVDGSYYLNLTRDETWVYMSDVIEAYAWLENAVIFSEHETLFDSFPEDSKYLNSAVSAYASVQARMDNVSSAVSLADTLIRSTTEDKTLSEKIEALTFKNEYNPKIGMTAVDIQDFNGALEAASLALSYSDRIYNSGSDFYKSSYKIQKGYLRTALIFHLSGNNSYENLCFSNAEKVLNGGTITGEGYSYTPGPITGTKYYIDAALASAVTANETGNQYYEDLFIELARQRAVWAFNSINFDYEDKTDFLLDVIETCSLIKRHEIISGLYQTAVDSASGISVSDNDEDDIITEAEELIKLGNLLASSGFEILAADIFELALGQAYKVQTAKDKTDLLTEAAVGFSKASYADRGLEIAESIEFTEEKFDAIAQIALKIGALRDDFPETTGATIDFDKDGKPYFFSPLLTDEEIVQTGLTLDKDSDNDGIEDIYDTMPLYKN